MYVDDASAEVLRDLPQLDPIVRRRDPNLEQHELAVNELRLGVIDDLDHVDEFLQLLLHLLDRHILARDRKGRARHPRRFGLRDG